MSQLEQVAKTPFEQLYEKTKAEQRARMAAGGRMPVRNASNTDEGRTTRKRSVPLIVETFATTFGPQLAYATPQARSIRETNLDRAFLTAMERKLRNSFNAAVLDMQFADRANTRHLHKCRDALAKVQAELNAVIAGYDALLPKPKKARAKGAK